MCEVTDGICGKCHVELYQKRQRATPEKDLAPADSERIAAYLAQFAGALRLVECDNGVGFDTFEKEDRSEQMKGTSKK